MAASKSRHGNAVVKADMSVDTADPGLTTHLTLGIGPRGLPRLTAIGFVDIATAQQFAKAVHEAGTGQRLLLDLTQVRFVGTAGITVLFQWRASFAAVLVAADSIVDRALSVAGFPTIPTGRASTATALR